MKGVPVAIAIGNFGVPWITLYNKESVNLPTTCKPGPENVLKTDEGNARVGEWKDWKTGE